MTSGRDRVVIAVVAIGLGLLAACAVKEEVIQRLPEGPAAEEIYRARFALQFGRPPTYEETGRWRDALDEHIGRYLTAHPSIDTSPRGRDLRFERRATLGMSRDEIALLLGPPDRRSSDTAIMSEAASRFWAEVSERATEMWVYPAGWTLYFDGSRLVDVTLRRLP
jgi:hypothetical protein